MASYASVHSLGMASCRLTIMRSTLTLVAGLLRLLATSHWLTSLTKLQRVTNNLSDTPDVWMSQRPQRGQVKTYDSLKHVEDGRVNVPSSSAAPPVVMENGLSEESCELSNKTTTLPAITNISVVSRYAIFKMWDCLKSAKSWTRPSTRQMLGPEYTWMVFNLISNEEISKYF